MFIGAGTALNVLAILVGSSLGVLLGHRLAQRTRYVVTDALGLVTALVAALSAASVRDPALLVAVGSSAPVLIVLGSLLVGGIAGSVLRIEDRLEGLGDLLRRGSTTGAAAVGADGAATVGADGADAIDRGRDRRRFIDGFVTASLLFCVGPLTVLGSIQDGVGRGIDTLALKATLDGFASIAFAASFGWGVAASVIAVLVVQGSLTLFAVFLGAMVPEAHLATLTAAGGLVLAGVALRLLRVRDIPVGDLLPALLVAPLLTEIILRLR